MARRTRFQTQNPHAPIADGRSVRRRQPIRIAGMEWGTALLAGAACLVLGTGTAVLTHSVAAPVVAITSIALGLTVTLRILRFPR